MPGIFTIKYSEVVAAIHAERARKRKEIDEKIHGFEKERGIVTEQIQLQ